MSTAGCREVSTVFRRKGLGASPEGAIEGAGTGHGPHLRSPGLAYMGRRSLYQAAAWPRDCTPSLSRMLATWRLTVCGLRS